MAMDAALMARARRTGETVVRIYTWSRPTLSLGRNQRTIGAYDAAALAASGLGVVRRPTGGRALLHHRELTYSVTAPARDSASTSYAFINALLLNALRSLGVPAELARPEARGLPPSSVPCFAEPSAGEVVAGGRKLVGSAQWRDAGAMLQHGSILVDDDQSMIGTVMLAPPGEVPAPATLRALLGRAPAAGELAEAMMAAVRTLADEGATWMEPEPAVREEAEREAVRFRDEGWTWRR